MYSLEKLISIDKNGFSEESKSLRNDDIEQLVKWLSEKDDKIRYPSFMLLQNRSAVFDDVYPFWETFYEKLKSENSYQRSIGLMLIAENVKWDKENKFINIINEYSLIFTDEKPITVRQCIQSLQKIIPFKKELHFTLADKLMAIDVHSIKETMRKLILTDIIEVLISIRKYQTNDAIESYIFNAFNGELLDKKAKKNIESIM